MSNKAFCSARGTGCEPCGAVHTDHSTASGRNPMKIGRPLTGALSQGTIARNFPVPLLQPTRLLVVPV